MKILPIALSALVVAFASVGPTFTATAVAADAKAPRTIEVTANDQMKFSVTKIEAKAGETIKIAFTNAGTMPKDAMGHNFVVLKPGTDAMAFASAAAAARATDYIPESMKDAVVGHTAVLGPKKSEDLVLKDLKAGEYTFLCSFVGHFMVGMKGTIVVK